MQITGSKLYDYIQCPHRIWRDVYGPQDEKIQETNPFVEMLWKKGISHEKDIVASLGTFVDLSSGTQVDRYNATLQAMQDKTPLIYQGVLIGKNLLGIPDLLELQSDGSYIPVDIKSGAGFDGADFEEDDEDEGKPKKHYAVQLALYVDILQQLGFLTERRAAVIDIHGKRVVYDLEKSLGVRNKTTLWEFYEQTRDAVNALLLNKVQNKPALGGICKLCPWYKSCKKWCKEQDDLTGLFYLGRKNRDTINQDLKITRIAELAEINVADVIEQKEKDKTFLKGIGEKTLNSVVGRANVMHKLKKPVMYEKITFPEVRYELFFDIEDDPTQEFVYMHGVYERTPEGERYIDFTATEVSPAAEKEAWQRFWNYIRYLPVGDYAVYYYSHHEKTTYRRLQRQYSEVVSEQEFEDFFNNPSVIDLYRVVTKSTDWPVGSYSIKELAVYLGFKWRDETPSGALSIQWYNDYLETKDPGILERILIYNEDDCKATMVLKDGLVQMSNSFDAELFKAAQLT